MSQRPDLKGRRLDYSRFLALYRNELVVIYDVKARRPNFKARQHEL